MKPTAPDYSPILYYSAQIFYLIYLDITFVKVLDALRLEHLATAFFLLMTGTALALLGIFVTRKTTLKG